MNTYPDDFSLIAKRALGILSDQCNELEGRVQVLARAIRDIEEIAADNVDLDSHAWNSVWHITQTGGVKTAMGA